MIHEVYSSVTITYNHSNKENFSSVWRSPTLKTVLTFVETLENLQSETRKTREESRREDPRTVTWM